MQPSNSASIFACASSGAIQWLLGPASSRSRLQTKVRCSTRATSPGSERCNQQSGWVIIDTDAYAPLKFGKEPNPEVATRVRGAHYHALAIEQIGHYGTGMPAGKTVFDTCVWIGRFIEAANGRPQLVQRGPVKLHHTGQPRAKDPNVTQALIDRFAPGQPNHGKGTKANPGWFYGFAKDIWQAYALAVYAADTNLQGDPTP